VDEFGFFALVAMKSRRSRKLAVLVQPTVGRVLRLVHRLRIGRVGRARLVVTLVDQNAAVVLESISVRGTLPETHEDH